MERVSTQRARLDRIADRLTPSPTLRRMAERAAREYGLEPAVVLAEAERILAEAADSGRTAVETIVADRDLDPAAVRREAEKIMKAWEAEGR